MYESFWIVKYFELFEFIRIGLNLFEFCELLSGARFKYLLLKCN